VISLEKVRRADILLVGGKGANLGELIYRRFPVPNGFVVTTAGYDQFVEYNHLNFIISEALTKQPKDGSKIREAFEKGSIPSDLKNAIELAYHSLGQGPVAVRSSATAEDLQESAFAGQQDTFLNIIGIDNVLISVKRCFASLWNDRAIAYREKQGYERFDLKLAVVVQRMVDARVAGVMFTANPVNGIRDQIVIESAAGLGEAVVSGLVTPDRFVLERKFFRGWQIVERTTGRGEVLIRSLKEGGTEQITVNKIQNLRVQLSDRDVVQLAQLGSAIQRHFHSPQDIEWAQSHDSKLFILQARPMTALPEPPPRVGRLTRSWIAIGCEIFHTRPFPLDITAWIPTVFYDVLNPFLQLFGIKLHSLNQLFVIEDNILSRINPLLPGKPNLKLLLSMPWRVLWNAFRYNPQKWESDPDLVKAKERVQVLESCDLESLTWDQLFTMINEELSLLRPLAGQPRVRYFARGLIGTALLFLLLKIIWSGEHFGTLLSGVKTKTTETNRELEKLAATIRSNPTLTKLFETTESSKLKEVLQEHSEGRTFLIEFHNFLNRYGYRETSPVLLSLPMWKDTPEIVFGILKVLTSSPPRLTDEKSAWEQIRDQLLSRSLLLRVPPLRRLFLWSLSQARSLIQVREDTHFNVMIPMSLLRRAFFEMGSRLVSSGVIEHVEDIFSLTLSDLKRINENWPLNPTLNEELRSLVRFRKTKRESLKNTPLIDPRILQLKTMGENVLLTGSPGSPGIAEGPVCIICQSSDFDKLRQGDVLVAPYTNPSWTPLFQRAVAVVVDTGGAGSHAAIVAREYGIPAVMGTGDGTQRLSNGEWVRVDGTQGLVFKATNPSQKCHQSSSTHQSF
jgi:pyruvate,water dikinase